jgi:hypothetical protein
MACGQRWPISMPRSAGSCTCAAVCGQHCTRLGAGRRYACRHNAHG